MLTLQALMCFQGNNDRDGWTIWNCGKSPRYPIKRARPKSKVIQLNLGGVRTYASCVATSNIGEL